MKFETLSAKSPKGPVTYLDHNATTPLGEAVEQHVSEWLREWGNPGSIHQVGRGPKALIRQSREKLASMLGVHPLEIVLTSGGSESNNLAIKGFLEARRLRAAQASAKFLFSSVEHPSVRRVAEYLTKVGERVAFIPVSRRGEIDMEAYKDLLTEDTVFVSVMLANNETGNIFPIKKMATLAHAKGAVFHTDAVQALGKMPVNLKSLGVDLASFSGHKFYALKGVGALYVRRGLNLESLIHGGGQERHRRGGTENVLAIASLGLMCDFKDQVVARAEYVGRLRQNLERRVLAEIPDVSVTGQESPRLPGTSSFVLPGVDGETLLMNLDMQGFAVSTGAACSSGSPEPSSVLLAMGLSRAEAQSSLRIGLGWGNTEEEVDSFVEALKKTVVYLRSLSGRGEGSKPSHLERLP